MIAGLLVAAALAGAVLVVVGTRDSGPAASAAPLPSRDFAQASVADPVTGALPSLRRQGGSAPGGSSAAGPGRSAPADRSGRPDGSGQASVAPGAGNPGGAGSPGAGPAPAVATSGTLSEPDDPQADITPQAHSAAADPAQRPQQPAGALAPNRLVIPALGVDAVVATSGLDDGSLVLPERVNQVTRWAGSAPADSDAGTMLIAGHVDNRRQGTGALFWMHTLQPGDAIYLTVDGVVTRWKTTALQSFSKQALPEWVWSGTRGERRLALVTCGGAFANGHYADNVVLTAVPF